MLQEAESKKRTIAATLLGNNSDESSIESLCVSLKNEKALYSRIAMSEALSKIGELAVPHLIHLLGQIGNNQETELPKKYFSKKSYPLARDMAARTLVNMAKPATPYLIESLETDDEFKVQQALDALGGIAAKTGDQRAFNSIAKMIDKCKGANYANKITLWKIIRSLSGFKNNKKASNLLSDIIKNNSDPPFVWEAARSLGQIGINSPEIIELLQNLENNQHPEIKKAAKNALVQINIKNY
jgi:HEAT repeat protein